MSARINSHYRDTLFRSIFGTEQHKDWLLSLYNALTDRNYTSTDDLTLTTIEGVIYTLTADTTKVLTKKYHALYDYCRFVDCVKENIAGGQEKNAARRGPAKPCSRMRVHYSQTA